MAIPAALNIALNLILIPRLGLTGALVATTASYGAGLVASILLGRLAQPLPLPWAPLARAGLAAAAMGVVVANLPSLGGLLELGLKAGVGALVYAPRRVRARRGRCAHARTRRLTLTLRTRMAT